MFGDSPESKPIKSPPKPKGDDFDIFGSSNNTPKPADDLDDLFGSSPIKQETKPVDDLDDLFGTSTPEKPKETHDLIDDLFGPSVPSQPVIPPQQSFVPLPPPPPTQPNVTSFVAYSDDNIQIKIDKQVVPNSNETKMILHYTTGKNLVDKINLQVAVPKYETLKLFQPSSTQCTISQSIKQNLKVYNNSDGKVYIMLYYFRKN